VARTRRSAAGGVAADDDRGPGLDVGRIVQAALQLLDEVGLDGLSMLHLAKRLDIKAPSLYWYIRDKGELLGLLAEAISAEFRPPDAELAWRPRLEAMGREYRRVLLARRDAARVLALSLPSGPHRLRLVDMVLQTLLEAGFAGLEATRAGRMLVDYATGFVQDEADNAAQAARNSPPFPAVAAEAYPTIARLAPYLMDMDGEARFDFGLTVLLDGLGRRLSVSVDGYPDRGDPL
jgi:TetR/AcrR family transcriptional regulator, tetracycline repressor protein